jgi:hypothetical protein
MLPVCIPPINFRMPEPVFMKLGMYIMAPEHISMVYFINPSHQTVCLYVYITNVARQQLSRNITAATNTHATIAELLGLFRTLSIVLYVEDKKSHNVSEPGSVSVLRWMGQDKPTQLGPLERASLNHWKQAQELCTTYTVVRILSSQ